MNAIRNMIKAYRFKKAWAAARKTGIIDVRRLRKETV